MSRRTTSLPNGKLLVPVGTVTFPVIPFQGSDDILDCDCDVSVSVSFHGSPPRDGGSLPPEFLNVLSDLSLSFPTRLGIQTEKETILFIFFSGFPPTRE